MTTPNPDFQKLFLHDPERPQLACGPISMQFVTRVAMHVVMKQVRITGEAFQIPGRGFQICSHVIRGFCAPPPADFTNFF